MDFVRSSICQNISMYLQHIIRRVDRQQDECLDFNILISLLVNEKADIREDVVRGGANQGNNQDKKDKVKKIKKERRKQREMIDVYL
jgi:hypothetical protein